MSRITSFLKDMSRITCLNMRVKVWNNLLQGVGAPHPAISALNANRLLQTIHTPSADTFDKTLAIDPKLFITLHQSEQSVVSSDNVIKKISNLAKNGYLDSSVADEIIQGIKAPLAQSSFFSQSSQTTPPELTSDCLVQTTSSR